MTKRGGWIAALAAFLVVAGAVFAFLKAVVLEDRRSPLPPWGEEAGGPLESHLDLWPVVRCEVADPEGLEAAVRSFVEAHPGVDLQWSPGRPGVVRVTLEDGEVRARLPALVVQDGVGHEWTGVLPSSAALEVRIGIPTDGLPVRFEGTVEDGAGRPHPLFSETQVPAPRSRSRHDRLSLPFGSFLTSGKERNKAWRSVRVDLSAWGGKSVRIRLKGESEPKAAHPGLGFYGVPRIWFSPVEKPLPKRRAARPLPGTSVVLSVLETRPGTGGGEDVFSRKETFLRESVFYSRFYTSDVRSDRSFRSLFSTSTASSVGVSWTRRLAESGYRTVAVGAFTDGMMATLGDAGFDEIYLCPHDGYDSGVSARRAMDAALEGRRRPVFVLVFFRDLPRWRCPPARYWASSFRAAFSPHACFVLWRRATDEDYLDDPVGNLWESLNGGSDGPLTAIVSLRGNVTEATPVLWPRTHRRGKVFWEERGWGMRESEVRVLFAFQKGGRWPLSLCRGVGQIPAVGSTLLTALDFPGFEKESREWNEGPSRSSEESSGRWVIRSPRAKALVVDGRFKYIRHDLSARVTVGGGGIDFPAEEVFDLWTDPMEHRNLVRARRHLLGRLREELGQSDPDPVEVRLAFSNPTGALVSGTVTCSAGAIAGAWGTPSIDQRGTYDFSFSTTASSGQVTFLTWPPDSSFSLRFTADRRPLSSGQFVVSRWGLPLFESMKKEWFDKTEFGWMDGWVPPISSTGTTASLGRVTVPAEDVGRSGKVP